MWMKSGAGYMALSQKVVRAAQLIQSESYSAPYAYSNLSSFLFQTWYLWVLLWLCMSLVIQLCSTLCHPMDCSSTGLSVHGICQARILEWVAIFSSRRSSWSRNWTGISYISCISCIAGRFFTCWGILAQLSSPTESLKTTDLSPTYRLPWFGPLVAGKKPLWYSISGGCLLGCDQIWGLKQRMVGTLPP